MLTNELPDRETQFRQLKSSLEALSASPSEEPALFADLVAKGDELAQDFDKCAAAVRGREDTDLSEAQLAALAAIDGQLATMSRLAAELDVDMWSAAARNHDAHWVQIRELSANALQAFGWDEERS
jgi:hypothetical protein